MCIKSNEVKTAKINIPVYKVVSYSNGSLSLIFRNYDGSKKKFLKMT